MVSILSVMMSVVMADPIRSIVVTGNQRYSRGTLLTYAAIAEGDDLASDHVAQIIHNLYLTEFFDDLSVQYDLEKETLYIHVVEKPILSDIQFSGYLHFSKSEIEKSLVEYKIEVSRPFNQRSLENMIRELQKLYAIDGYYEANITYQLKKQDNGTMILVLNIDEGATARISSIHFHGNVAFPSYVLNRVISLQSSNVMTFLTAADKYSEYKLEQDCLALENYYHDNGYPAMKVVDRRIALTDEKKGIVLDLFIDEGPRQTITQIEIDAPVSVDCALPRELDLPLLWNQSAINNYDSNIRDALNLQGYVYGEIRQDRIELDNDGHVKLVYRVFPGPKYRIRNYHIRGNTLTQERIVRNFITRPEGSMYSSVDLKDLNASLSRTGLFRDVQLHPQAIAGSEIDIYLSVEEDKTKKIFATGGASNIGYMWNVGFEDRNILGTGTRSVLKYESDTFESSFQFALSNPYITKNNVEGYFNFERIYRSYGNKYMYFKEQRNIYSTTLGATWKLTSNIRYGLSSNYFIEKDNNSTEVLDNGEKPWAHYVFLSNKLFSNMFNRYILPDQGHRWDVFCQTSLPLGDYTYVDCGFSFQYYYPLGRSGWTLYQSLVFRSMFPYGETSKSVIPSTRLMSCGGAEDIRGYHFSSVGPEIQTLQSDGTYTYKTVGGNIKGLFKTELIIPNSLFNLDYDQLRFSLFLDAAQLWRTVAVPDSYNENGNTYLPAEGIRLTTGICARFISPIMPPMTISLNYPLIQKDRDHFKYEYLSFGSQIDF